MKGNQNKRNGLTQNIQFRISPSLAKRLESAARTMSTEAVQVTQSDLARIALDRYLPPLPEGEL
jgi:hypothetical protein